MCIDTIILISMLVALVDNMVAILNILVRVEKLVHGNKLMNTGVIWLIQVVDRRLVTHIDLEMAAHLVEEVFVNNLTWHRVKSKK